MIEQLHAGLKIVCLTSLEQFISIPDHDQKKTNNKSTTITDATSEKSFWMAEYRNSVSLNEELRWTMSML